MDNLVNREFANSAHPLNWYEVAQLIHENAKTLHFSPQGAVAYGIGGNVVMRRTSNRSVFLLATFAMENLIKAFLIYENPQYIEGGKLSNQLTKGHSLSKLQQKCKKIPAPIRTLDVLKALEVGVNSWARYPCATSVERDSIELTVTAGLWESYNKAFVLYSKRLESLLSKRWKGPFGEITQVKFEYNQNHCDVSTVRKLV